MILFNFFDGRLLIHISEACFCICQFDNLSHVFFPTIPSAASPFSVWNSFTAAKVFVPNIPSMAPTEYPKMASCFCKYIASSPRLPLLIVARVPADTVLPPLRNNSCSALPFSALSAYHEWAKYYWRGRLSEKPKYEVLCELPVTVLDSIPYSFFEF